MSALSTVPGRFPGMTSSAGFFVAFEGGEGAGKSTQVKALAARLAAAGREVVVTREPGGTPIGATIRALLLDEASHRMTPITEALLYAADRAQHVAEVVRPAINRRAVVISDRYLDSSLAYQGAARPIDSDDVEAINEVATGGMTPDLTVLLDIDPVLGLERSGRTDRLEAEPLAFHQKVRARFLELAADYPERYLVVPADQDPAVIAEAVAARVDVAIAANDAMFGELFERLAKHRR
jgi:dTMP kinase